MRPSLILVAVLLAMPLAVCAETPVAAPAVEAPAIYRVGTARVVALVDGRGPFPVNLFQGIAAADVSRLLAAGNEATTNADGSPAWAASVYAFVVDIGGKRVLVDTGAGGALPGTGRLAAGLAAAGIPPASIDVVVISHMHGDHIGGLLDATGRPAFAKATLQLSAAEAGYWGDPAKAAAASAGERGSFDAARRIFAAYGPALKPFDGRATIVPGLTAEPLYGHTPGHAVYRLRSGGREMVFIGDMIHSLAIQMPRPTVTLGFDSDQDAARAARLGFLRANAGKGVLFAGPHFRTGVVTIEPDGAAFRATPVTPGR